MKPVIVHVETYNHVIHAFLGCDPSVVQKFIEKKFGLIVPPVCAAGLTTSFTHHKLSNQIIITLPEYKQSSIDMLGVLSHECLHAALIIFGNIGHKIDPEAPCEDLTYLHQFIFTRIMHQYKKRK